MQTITIMYHDDQGQVEIILNDYEQAYHFDLDSPLDTIDYIDELTAQDKFETHYKQDVGSNETDACPTTYNDAVTCLYLERDYYVQRERDHYIQREDEDYEMSDYDIAYYNGFDLNNI